MKIKNLFSPEELEKLRDLFWGKYSHKTKFSDTNTLPSIAELILLLNGGYKDNVWHSGKTISINASRVCIDGTIETLSNIPNHNANNLFNSGYTLCFNDVSQFTSELKALKDSAISYFGGVNKVVITCYLTPKNSSGVLHYDRQHNFFIQTEGHKKWTVSERPAIGNPFDNLVYPGATKELFDTMEQQGYKILKPVQCGKIKYDLYPNDVLYVPPGFYHVAETEEEASLHFTLTLEPLSFLSEINPHIFRALISNCTNSNKDIRMLSVDDAEKHFQDCMSNLINSLTTMQPKDLLIAHNATKKFKQ